MLEKLIKFPILQTILVSSFLFYLCHCNIFNAEVELESLFELQRLVSDAVGEYLKKEELRLDLVRQKFMVSSGLSKVGVAGDGKISSAREIVPLHQNDDNFKLLNPINAFLAIKGLSADLADILKPALDRSNIKVLSRQIDKLTSTKKFPQQEDLKGAAVALIRLQDTYLLKTELLSKGCLLDDLCSSIHLSVDDCFEIGKQSYQERNYDYAISWFNEALRKLEEDSQDANMNNTEIDTRFTNFGDFEKVVTQKSEILENLAWAEDIKNTLNVGKRFLSELTGIELDAFIDEVVKAAENQPTEGEAEDLYSTVLRKYEALCRGEGRELPSQNPKLSCFYSNRLNNPYFAIGRVKEEQIHLDPPLVMFHNVLYDSEIEVIKKLATPRFETATVVNAATGDTQHSSTRVSKSAWLIDEDHDAIGKLNKRIKQLTNLDLSMAEDLQVANYGIGGMYLPHFDFSHTNETRRWLPEDEGDRIATLMFYMSDVRVGGATSFPHLGVSVWPEKGAAAFWYNLKPDGRGDFRTQHGACPVMFGSKWVSNKWIHERGQEFLRPCQLEPNDGSKSKHSSNKISKSN